MLRLLSGARDWLRQRGPFFIPNLVVAALLLWFIAPFFGNRSDLPVVFGRYSLIFFAWLVVAVLVAAVIISMAVLGSRRLNRHLFLMVLAVFFLGEALARLTGPPVAGALRDRPNSLNYPSPYVVFGGEPGADLSGREKLNELGFRGPVPPKEKGDEYRIIVLGGSAVWVGQPLGDSLPSLLESLFRRDGRDNVKVYNWGWPAYVSGQELAVMAHTVLDYEPDVVIVYDGVNDVYSPYVNDPRPGYPYRFITVEEGLRELRNVHAGRTLTMTGLIRSSRLLTLIHSHLDKNRLDTLDRDLLESRNRQLRPEQGYGTGPWREKIAAIYASNQRKMCSLARGANFKLVLFLQPMLAFKRPVVGKEASVWNPEVFQNHAREAYDLIRRSLGEADTYNRRGDCYFFDLSNLFDGFNAEVYADFVHVSRDGNMFVAGAIYDKLKETGLTGASGAARQTSSASPR